MAAALVALVQFCAALPALPFPSGRDAGVAGGELADLAAPQSQARGKTGDLGLAQQVILHTV